MSPDSPEVEETPEQRALAEIAVEKWNVYQEKYVPLENEYMARIDDMSSDWQTNRAAGDANKAFVENFSSAKQGLEAGQFDRGINPNSGSFDATTTGLEAAKAGKTAEGMTASLQQQEDKQVSGINSIVQMGQGQSADAQRGFSESASASAGKAEAAAQDEYRSGASNRTMVGTAGGMLASYGLNEMKKSDGDN